ncbi:DUF3892 domain-containing protein [Pseudomonas peradeniyensis]|uniref:DUF3892 domain-containing protein n=1 Tax=Pseudomonas peradeniyensis TaxID=2745488 RepID=UPI0021D4A3F7|nr:DUF3892 domain-containing protein [Pseudomonas peradeniyensis]MCU7283268.1 DUF3892 domain-containing protein [Pseudomonas peradeniyensis]
MAEYLIFAVSYSEKDEHIEWLLIARQEGKGLKATSIVSRAFIVDLIKNNVATFKTAVIRDKIFYRGADVVVYDEDFLTTTADATEENNLQRLPSFVVPQKEIDDSIKMALEEAYGSI